MTGIKHKTQTAKTNNPDYDVSANAWNEAHEKGTTADVLTDHDKTLHDALDIDAATLDGSTKAQVQTHTPASHGNEAHSSEFLVTESDPYVDATMQNKTLTEVRAHAPAAHTLDSHSEKKLDTLDEKTNDTGVTVDSCLIKDGLVANSNLLEGSTKAQVQTHAPAAHTLASHSTRAHSELTNVGEADHHAKFTTTEHDTVDRHTLESVVPHDALASLTEKSHTSLTDKGTNTHAQIDTHVASASNPHAVTKAQVSLSSVTDDAQLKRADGDINTFSEKTVPVDADIVLIEDSAALYTKKKATLANLGLGGDMTKAVYDTDANNVVDNSEKLEGSTKAQVQTHAPQTHTHDETELSFTDITTLNSSITKHGLLKKLSNVGTEFLNGLGNWATPSGGSGEPHQQAEFLIYKDGSTYYVRNGDTGSTTGYATLALALAACVGTGHYIKLAGRNVDWVLDSFDMTTDYCCIDGGYYGTIIKPSIDDHMISWDAQNSCLKNVQLKMDLASWTKSLLRVHGDAAYPNACQGNLFRNINFSKSAGSYTGQGLLCDQTYNAAGACYGNDFERLTFGRDGAPSRFQDAILIKSGLWSWFNGNVFRSCFSQGDYNFIHMQPQSDSQAGSAIAGNHFFGCGTQMNVNCNKALYLDTSVVGTGNSGITSNVFIGGSLWDPNTGQYQIYVGNEGTNCNVRFNHFAYIMGIYDLATYVYLGNHTRNRVLYCGHHQTDSAEIDLRTSTIDNILNYADASLSGTPKVATVAIGGIEYYFKVYPTKT